MEARGGRAERRELRGARSEEMKARGGRAEHRKWWRLRGGVGRPCRRWWRPAEGCGEAGGDRGEEEEVHRYVGKAKEEGGRLLEEAGPTEKPNPRRERL